MRNNYKVYEDHVIIYMDRKSGEILETKVSLTSLEKLMKINVKWYAHYDPKMEQFYVTGYLIGSGRGSTKLKLHRIITDAIDGLVVDHLNHDTLDNRLENLKVTTYQQNQRNRRMSKHNTSGARNVRFKKGLKKPYQAYVTVDRKFKSLGYYETLEEASNVAEEGIKEHYKDVSINVI